MSYHTTNRSINRHKGNRTRVRHQLNNRPGLLNNFIVLPTAALTNCLLNPFYLVNFNCNNILLDLTHLVTLPINQKLKTNEPLLTLTPFLCFFLPPSVLHTGVNRVNMDYFYRYLLLFIFFVVMYTCRCLYSVMMLSWMDDRRGCYWE